MRDVQGIYLNCTFADFAKVEFELNSLFFICSLVSLWGAILFSIHRLKQPRLTVCPVPLGGRGGNAQGCRGLFDGQAGEVAEFHQFRLLWFDRREAVERFIERDEVFARFRRGDRYFGGVVAEKSAAVLGGVLAAGVFHEDPPHRLGRGSEEVAAMIEARDAALSRCGIRYQPEVCFVNEGGGFECVPGVLAQLRRGEFPQLVIDERKQLPGCRFAGDNILQNTRKLVHGQPGIVHSLLRPGRLGVSHLPGAGCAMADNRIRVSLPDSAKTTATTCPATSPFASTSHALKPRCYRAFCGMRIATLLVPVTLRTIVF